MEEIVYYIVNTTLLLLKKLYITLSRVWSFSLNNKYWICLFRLYIVFDFTQFPIKVFPNTILLEKSSKNRSLAISLYIKSHFPESWKAN